MTFRGNNSSKPEPTGTKFYTETSAQVALSLHTFGALRKKGRKWLHFPNFFVFVTKTTHF